MADLENKNTQAAEQTDGFRRETDEDFYEPERLAWRRDKGLWISVLVLIAALVVLFFSIPKKKTASGEAAQERLITGKVAVGSVDSLFRGTGTLTDNEAEELKIPDKVELLSYTVKEGDRVAEGDVLARVDRVSVMACAAELQAQMNELDKQTEKITKQWSDPGIYSRAGGRVMAVYVQPGDDVGSVMYQYGALASVSADGFLKVTLPWYAMARAGEAVTVRGADGRSIPGTVSAVTGTDLTITVSDTDAALGEEVSVVAADGTELGSGVLEINSELKITGYSGTARYVHVTEGENILPGQIIVTLSNTGYDAVYDAYLRQREEYAAVMSKLMEMYREGYVYAPCDGIVSELRKNERYLPIGGAGSADSLAMSGDGAAQLILLGDTPEPEPEPAEEKIFVVRGTVEAFVPNMFIKLYGVATPYDILNAEVEAGVAVDKEVDVTIKRTKNEETVVDVSIAQSGGGGFIIINAGAALNAADQSAEPYKLTESKLCSVIPQDIMTVDVSVDELDILSLKLGQDARITLDAVPGQSFDGTVTKITRAGSNSGGSTKYGITVTVDRNELMLGGMNAAVRIPVDSCSDVLVIPTAAVVEQQGKSYVYTAYDPKEDRLLGLTEITTGLSDGDMVQVVSGLSDGETFFYKYADSLSIA